MLMSTYISGVFFRDRVCPGCKVHKPIDQFNQKTIRCRECARKYYIQNREKRLLSNKKYRTENKQQRYNYSVNYINKKLQTDSNFKLAHILRSRILGALKKRHKKAAKTVELLGCTVEEARMYIEKQFKDGMSWTNHGTKGWHIDHIIPCNTFNLKIPEQQRKCFHYTNLRPLWWYENLTRPNDGSDIKLIELG